MKGQKDTLTALYGNKNRPNLFECELNSYYYLIPTEFVKEWRSIIKNSKYKDIRIDNQMMLCEHGMLPFDEKSWDDSV